MELSNSSEDPDFLHYYCSSSTFLSLIKSSSFWLTAIALSNDRMEGLWAIKKYLDLFKAEDRRAVVGARAFLEGALNNRVALGMCFSREDDLLSQWRGYASGGRGLCVSFKVAYLRAAVQRLRLEHSKLKLTEVTYARSLSPDFVKDIYEEFSDQIDQARSGRDGDFVSMNKNYGNGGHDRETDLVSRFFSVKNPAFKEEREWRLLLVDYPSSISNLKFRESNGLLSPYVEIKIDLEAISSVTLGPLHPTPATDVERLLSTYGVSARVETSAASYVVR